MKGSEKAGWGVLGWFTGGSVLSGVLAGGITVLVIAAIAVPAYLSQGLEARDTNAKELLLNASNRIRACAATEGQGTFAGCDAREMREAETGIEWRDGVALSGWGVGRVGKVYVSDLGQSSYRLETTSGSGRIFSYIYEDGVIVRSTGGGGQQGSW